MGTTIKYLGGAWINEAWDSDVELEEEIVAAKYPRVDGYQLP